MGVNDSVWCTDKCVSSAKSEPVKVVPKMRIGTATPSIACIHVSVHGCMCGLCVWVSVCVRRGGGGEGANRGCDSVSKSVIVCVCVLVKKSDSVCQEEFMTQSIKQQIDRTDHQG